MQLLLCFEYIYNIIIYVHHIYIIYSIYYICGHFQAIALENMRYVERDVA